MEQDRVIKSVTVVASGAGVCTYSVGDTVNGMVIDKILDQGREWPDEIDFIYHCLDEDGKLVVSIENCPATICYSKVGGE